MAHLATTGGHPGRRDPRDVDQWGHGWRKQPQHNDVRHAAPSEHAGGCGGDDDDGTWRWLEQFDNDHGSRRVYDDDGGRGHDDDRGRGIDHDTLDIRRGRPCPCARALTAGARELDEPSLHDDGGAVEHRLGLPVRTSPCERSVVPDLRHS